MTITPLLALIFIIQTEAPGRFLEERPGLQLLLSDRRQVVIEFNPQTINISPDRSSISIPGTQPLALPGEPDLPGVRILVGCPQSGSVNLKWTIDQLQEFDRVNIRPAPALNDQPPVLAEAFARDRFFPGVWAEMEGIETIRNLRVAKIRLNPAQINPVSKKLRVARIHLTIEFTSEAQEVDQPDPLDPILARTLINGPTAVNWKIVHQSADTFNFFSRFPNWCRVRTETTGIYQITPADLKAAGFDPDLIDPRTFRLFTIGPYRLNGPYPDTMIEVPIYVPGEQDGRFNPQDFLLFYAQSPSWWNDSLTGWEENYYTRYRTFWLTWGKGPGRRMAELTGNAQSPSDRALNRVRIEQDLLCPARGGLLWLWERFSGTDQKFYLPFTLINRDTLKRLVVRFYAKSEGASTTYKTVLSLNGIILDTVSIRAQNQMCPPNTFVFESLPVLASSPGKKTDTLGLELIGYGDIYLDYIEVDYSIRLEASSSAGEFGFHTFGPSELVLNGVNQDALILNVTNPWLPVRLSGITNGQLKFQVLAPLNRIFCSLRSAFRQPTLTPRSPGQLRQPTETADYYIICPDEFLPAARILAQYRNNNIPGLNTGRVKAVGLSSIYDEYAFGMEEPGAIKAFLGSKRPVYGLLLGDATYDYKNNLKLNPPPGVPAYEIGFDLDYEVYNPVVKALDAWYADFDGGGSGPDMILARLTARSLTEIRRFLDKIRSYENQELDLWAKKLLLLGDDEYLGDVTRPESFIHIQGCEGIAPVGANLLELEKIYLTEYRLEGVNSKPRANAELLRQLNWGALLWCYFGHGSGFQLCHERAFHIDDVPRVHNGTRLPLAFFGSCGVGRFEDTRFEAIAEELVRIPEGCIATLGATKATYSSANENFAHIFFSKLLSQPQLPVGAAFYPAWLTYNLYILFGDPTIRVRLPQENLPVTVSPETLKPGGAINWSSRPGFSGGYYAVRATEAARQRLYSSDVGTISYILPGGEIFRLTGRFQDSLAGSLVVPLLDFPDTITVDNGFYARIRNSCQITGLVGNSSQLKSLSSEMLYLSPDRAEINDQDPPSLVLAADNITLFRNDTVRVPKRFRLHGRLSDPSGILLVPNLNQSLSFYIGEPNRKVELADYFRYDENNPFFGSFTYPVELDRTADSLVITAADNRLNARTGVYYLKTDLKEELRIDSALVYPNPVSGKAYFTFLLSRSATVNVKIYTIAGRLLRILGPYECPFGYNQIEWDGLDRDGNTLANGVYLYKIDARTGEVSGSSVQTRSFSFRDKLIVRN